MPYDPTLYLTGYSGVTPQSLALFLRREMTGEEEAHAAVCIESVEYELAKSCNRNFAYEIDDGYSVEPVIYEEKFDLPGSKFYPRAFPVADVESIVLLGEELELVEDTDYFIRLGSIDFHPGLSTVGIYKNGLVLQYTIKKFWGADVSMLIRKLAGQLWLNAENAGIQVRDSSFSSVREAFDLDDFNKKAAQVVARYRVRHV